MPDIPMLRPGKGCDKCVRIWIRAQWAESDFKREAKLLARGSRVATRETLEKARSHKTQARKDWHEHHAAEHAA